jgi:hypothetical protein
MVQLLLHEVIDNYIQLWTETYELQMILLIKVHMDIIINGEIIMDSRKNLQISKMQQVELGVYEPNDHVQLDGMYLQHKNYQK